MLQSEYNWLYFTKIFDIENQPSDHMVGISLRKILNSQFQVVHLEKFYFHCVFFEGSLIQIEIHMP